MLKLAKILRGINNRTETDLKEILGNIWLKSVKIDKNTEGVTNSYFDVKYDCKK
jgi:hypothetical protein